MSAPLQHNPALDGLRAFSAIAVVLFHSRGPLFHGGSLGVDMFFVLSSFLITSILAREFASTGSIDLSRFYWRRVVRLMPALLLLLAVYLTVAPIAWPGHAHGFDALLALLYVTDYTAAFWGMPEYLIHTWSLGVEEKFYILWPLILPLLINARNPLAWLCTAWLFFTGWRWMFSDFNDFYYRFDTRVTGLLMGAALYFVLEKITLRPFVVFGAAVTLTLLVIFSEQTDAQLFTPLAEILSAGIIAAACTGQLGFLGAVLTWSPIVWLGQLSYGIYLWHYPIAHYFRDGMDFIPTLAIVMTSATVLAAISYYTVERWARRALLPSGRLAPRPAAE